MKSLANIVFWFVSLFLIGSAYATEVTFQEHVIGGSLPQAYAVEAADIDSDGDLDVAVGWLHGVTWFENDGRGSFTQHEAMVPDKVGIKDIILVDFDDDMDCDILYVKTTVSLIGWLENDGNQHFTEREITRNAIQSYSIASVDLDGDGDWDVVSANFGDLERGDLAWYENDVYWFSVSSTTYTSYSFSLG